MANPSFPEWFCLNEGRRNFDIDPVRDRSELLGNPDWATAIDDRLKKAQLLATPIRVVWWGQFGIGKTHRLRYTEFLVQDREYAYRPCYTIASDIQEKTGFERLHYELINGLGRETMREIAKSYVLKTMTGPEVQPLAEICGSSADVVEAVSTFGGTNQRPVPAAWRFLCGRPLEKSEIDVAGVSKPRLERAGDFAGVIAAFATMIETETGKQLLYLVDECENLLQISNRTAEAQWNEALRAILDIKNVSLVLAVGAEKSDNIPVLILRPDIVRRVQKDNYVQMDAYKEPEANDFVKGLLKRWVDPSRRATLEKAEALADQVPDYDAALYPFTNGGLEMFCQGVTIDPRTAKPSEILAKLNNVTAEAYFAKRRLIDREHLTSLGFA